MKNTEFRAFMNKRIVCFTAAFCAIFMVALMKAGTVFSAGVLFVGVIVMFMFSDKKIPAVIMAVVVVLISLRAYSVFEKSIMTEGLQKEGVYTLKVISYPEVTQGRVKCLVKSMYQNEDMLLDAGDKIYLYVYADEVPHIKSGDIYEVSGKLKGAKANTTPGTFNYKNYLLSEGTRYSISVSSEDLTYIMTESLPFGYDKILEMRYSFEKTIEENMTSSVAGLLKGIMFGSAGRDNEILEDFRSLGVAHVLSVSGLHVGLIYGFFQSIISLFNIRNRKVKIMLSAVSDGFILLYVALSGFSVSCIRAAFLIWISTLSSLSPSLRGRYDTLNALSAIMLLSMIINPFVIFGAGFILSYLAVVGIVFINPAISSSIRRNKAVRSAYANRIFSYLMSLVTISISVQIMLTPVTVMFFGESTLLGVVYNLLVVPIVSACLILGVFGFILRFLACPILGAAGILLENTAYLARILTETDILRLSSYSMNVFIPAVYYTTVFVLAGYINITKKKTKIILSSLLAVCFIVSTVKYIPERYSSVSFMDVGFGDCAIIITKDNDCIIIDGGGGFYGGDTANEVILPYLRSEGIRKVTALIATHSDADHMGGITGLVGEIPVGVIYANDDGGSLYDELCEKAGIYNIPVKELWAKESLTYSDCHISVLSPDKEWHYSTLNDHSIVMDVTVGGVKYLFTGDAGKAAEKTILSSSDTFALKYDILKSAHHGSEFATDEFRLRLFCDVAVISVGDNGYGLPKEDFIGDIEEIGSEVYRTDELGLIKIISSGEGNYDIMSYTGKWRKVK